MAYKITNPVTGDVVKTAWGKRAWDAEMAFQTDAVNYKMFQEQNDWNMIMYNQQRADAQSDWERDTAYNEKMLADERAYNSPAAQRQRLVEAGYNPLALGNFGSSGSSGSPLSAPSENTPDAPVSANWAGASRVEDNAPSAIDILGSIVGSIGSLVGSVKQGVEAFELPQYVFNDTQRAASENSLRNMMLRKMYMEQPNWVDDQTANIWYRKASATAQEWVARREEATKKFIEEQTSWLPDISRSQIDEACSRFALNMKNIEVADESLRVMVQEIAESRSRAGLNWAQSSYVKLQNDLYEKYGPDQAEAALQAYEDQHNNMLVSTLMASLNIKQDDRDLWFRALKEANIYTQQDLDSFLSVLKKVKDGAVISPREQARWYEPIAALFPSLVTAGYFGAKAVSSIATRFGGTPVVLPSSNIYGQDLAPWRRYGPSVVN